jgi:hypothetical protein
MPDLLGLPMTERAFLKSLLQCSAAVAAGLVRGALARQAGYCYYGFLAYPILICLIIAIPISGGLKKPRSSMMDPTRFDGIHLSTKKKINPRASHIAPTSCAKKGSSSI